MNRKSLRCPKCGGVCNTYQPVVVRNKMILVCECWSGDLNKPSKYHIYTVPLKVTRNLQKRKLSAYNIFVAEALKDGKGITEAAKLWQKQKEVMKK